MHTAELTEKFMQYSEEMLACVQAVAPKNAQITQQGQNGML
jgi:hypothetical protein